jgi:hypothetical protein
MEFYERLPLQKLHFLNSLDFSQYKELNIDSGKKLDERKKNYEKMKNLCYSFIKANGQIKRLYKFTGDNNWNADGSGSGRLFSDGCGIQGLPKVIRGFLLKDTTVDIDMVNAHPVILLYLCKKHQIACQNLENYVLNRDEILSSFDDRDTAKKLFLKATNNDKFNKKETNQFFKDFDKEMKEIQKILTKLTCYENIVKDVPQNKVYNWRGSAINRILCFYENQILQVIISHFNHLNIEICSPMFDGCLVYLTDIDRSTIDEIELQINQQFSGINMKLLVKPHINQITMPDDFDIVDNRLLNMQTFDKVSSEFEKTHCKILNRSIFIRKHINENIVFSKQQFKCTYEHLVYEKFDKNEKIIKVNFISDWMNNNPTIRCYDDIGVYPNECECPSNIYNMWRPFEMETITEYEYKQSELNIILNHIRILCDNDDNVYQYFVSWIAQMIQYPSVKTICPTLISGEGAGKGTLLKLFSKMLGQAKVYETTSPSRDVWGDFNGRMCNTFLVNFNELSKKETVECEGRIKGLITDPHLTINNKGVNQFEINSFHRFIITTNNHEPINTKKGDRRQLVIRSSDEKCGDKEYFKMLHEILEDTDVVKTCYEYFKSIPNMDNFNSLPIPVTEHQEVLKELGESPIESWLRMFTLHNCQSEIIEMYPQETYNDFIFWCKENKIEFLIDSRKFGTRLTNLKISGVEKGRRTNKGDTRIFNIQKLEKYFNINYDNVIDNSNI